MKTHRTTRYQLHPPTAEKHQLLHGTAGACRYVWNHFVGKLQDEYECYGKSEYSFYTIRNQLTTLRKHYDTWLQDYSAYIVNMSLKPIQTTYKNFFNGNGSLPKFHSRYTHAPSFPIDNQSAQIVGSHIRFVKIGWMKFSGSNPYPEGVFKSGRVKHECGKWYLYIVYEVEVADKPHLLTEVGLDRNVGQVALSDGTFYRLPNLERKTARRKRYQRMVARRVKGSNRRKVAKIKLQKAYAAERFARANWSHHTSKLIAKKYDVVYIEGLNTSGMTKSAKGTMDNPGKNVSAKAGLNRAILGSAWGKLEQCLSYKTHVEKVPAHYTSQTCHKCGVVDKKSRVSQSVFKCSACGHEDNADINAALNILAVGRAATGRGDGDISRSKKRQKIATLRGSL